MIGRLRAAALAGLAAAVLSTPAAAQFVEDFSKPLAVDPQAHKGWAWFTGDGEATMSFEEAGGHGLMTIDARHDRRNIWWAIIKRSVSPYIDQKELARPDRALRVEATVRLSDWPRRVNLSVNHTHTTDFETNLAEFDIADGGWHTISFTTTKAFDPGPKDEIFAQLAMMDGGRAVYRVEIKDFKVSVVDPRRAGPDQGEPLPYRPPVPPLASVSETVPVAQDAILDAAYPWVNFRTWTDMTAGGGDPVLSLSGAQTAVLSFDLAKYRGRTPVGWGVLELTTDTVQWAPTDLEEFGYLRTVEIKSAAPAWTRDAVTYDSFFGGRPWLDVLNGQLIIDVPPKYGRGEKMLILISPPVLRRLISGETKGLAIYPQGAVNATYYSSQARDPALRPKLHFNVR